MDAAEAEAEAVGEETAVARAAEAKVAEPDVARASLDGEDVDEGPPSGTPYCRACVHSVHYLHIKVLAISRMA